MPSSSSSSFHGSSGAFPHSSSSAATFNGSSASFLPSGATRFQHYRRSASDSALLATTTPPSSSTPPSRQASPYFLFLLLPLISVIVSLVLVWTIYGNQNLEVGRNYSRLFTANSVFVKKIVIESGNGLEGPIFYGFSRTPALDKEKNWYEDHEITIPGNYHQEWSLWLNKGSKATMECKISPRNNDLLMAVIQGRGDFYDWVQNPTDSSLMSAYTTVRGKGALQFKMRRNDAYYFVLGNFKQSTVQAYLRLGISGKMYDTASAVSTCYLASRTCCLELPFLGSNTGLIASPKQIDEGDIWFVSVIYKIRWATFLVAFGACLFVELLIFLRFYPRQRESHIMEAHSENAPLVSFAESATPACFEDPTSDSKTDWHTDIKAGDDARLSGSIETSDENLCVICFDARKDCFFDPCGHCATCYQCGLRVKEKRTPLCPICRQSVRSIRKIFLT